jgi:hypothetical protein
VVALLLVELLENGVVEDIWEDGCCNDVGGLPPLPIVPKYALFPENPPLTTGLDGDQLVMEYDFFVSLPLLVLAENGGGVGCGGDDGGLALLPPLPIVPKYVLAPENPLLTTGLDGDHFDMEYDFFVSLPLLALAEKGCGTGCGGDDGGLGLLLPLPIVPKYALLPENPLLTTGLEGDHLDIEYDCFGPEVLAPGGETDTCGGGCCPDVVTPVPIVPKYEFSPENPLFTTGFDGDHFDMEYDCFGPVVAPLLTAVVAGGNDVGTDGLLLLLSIVPKYALSPENPLFTTGLVGDHFVIEYDDVLALVPMLLAPVVKGGGALDDAGGA